MFGKKILGLVTLLFINSQINKVLGTKCTADQQAFSASAGCDVSTYCFDDSESIIYGHDGSSCKKVADGAYVVDSSDAIIVLGTDTIDTTSEYSLYNCNGDDCSETVGYVKNSANYYLIKDGENAESVTPVNVLSAKACLGNVGKLVQVNGVGDAYLCLTQSKSVKLDASTTGSYLALNLGGSVFESTATEADNTKVVITAKENALVLDTLYTDTETHCYDDADGSIMPRIDNFCEGTGCDKYYLCTAGVCTMQKNVCPRGSDGGNDDENNDSAEPCDPSVGTNCEAGYYLYDSGLKVKGEDTGTFYVCDGNKQGPCSTTIPSVGYFINAAYDATQAAADSTNHNAQYIKCSGITNPTDCTAYNAAGGSCTADGLVYSNGGHVYLCLDATRTVSVQLDGSDEEDTDYFIYANDASNIFGPSNDKYIFVNVNAGNVTPSETVADGELYKYADSNYKVLDKSVGVCNYNGYLYEFAVVCDESTPTVTYEYKNSKEVQQSP